MTTGRLLLLAWLALVWVLLWGSVTGAVLLSAAVAAPLCLAASRLPRNPTTSHPAWLRMPAAVARFAADLVASSLQVSWATLSMGPRTTSAVLAVSVPAASDVALTVVAHRLSLEPGTLVLEVDRDAREIYVYVLDVRDRHEAEAARRRVRRVTDDMLRTLGRTTVDTEGGDQ